MRSVSLSSQYTATCVQVSDICTSIVDSFLLGFRICFVYCMNCLCILSVKHVTQSISHDPIQWWLGTDVYWLHLRQMHTFTVGDNRFKHVLFHNAMKMRKAKCNNELFPAVEMVCLSYL